MRVQVVQLGGSVTLYGRRNCAIGIVSELLCATVRASFDAVALPSVDRPMLIKTRGQEPVKELAKPAQQT